MHYFFVQTDLFFLAPTNQHIREVRVSNVPAFLI
jgi:hypothetical protein